MREQGIIVVKDSGGKETSGIAMLPSWPGGLSLGESVRHSAWAGPLDFGLPNRNLGRICNRWKRDGRMVVGDSSDRLRGATPM